MNIAVLYTLFAIVATVSNIATQAVVVRIAPGAWAIPASIAVGTVVGLVVKYALDKRWIFRWKPQSARHNAGTFLLYAFTGVFTTAIFWGCEFLFSQLSGSEGVRYIGGVIGLAIGYVLKYQMDRVYVFAEVRHARLAQRATIGLVVALLTLTIGKMFLIVESPQMIALSNNWDFIRVESCMGLWQEYGDGTPKTESHLSAPVNRLILDRDVKMDSCVISIDDIYPYVATRFRKTGARVDFRVIGTLKFVSVLIALAMLLRLARDARSKLIVSAMFFASFGDMIYLLYFNTLYNEFSQFLGAFLCATTLWLLWTGSTRSVRATIYALGSGAVLLGLSKQQYSGLATLFALIGALLVFVRFRYRRPAVVLAVVGLACPVIFSAVNPSDYGLPQAIKMANITDTILGEVLPHASNREQALKLLHMPPECEQGIGKTWYTPGMQANHPCPSLINASRIRLIPLFALQPQTFFGPMSDGLERAYPVPEGAYGIFERPGTADSPRYKIAKYTSLTTYVNMLPAGPFRWIMIAAMLFGVAAAIRCLVTIKRTGASAELLVAIGGVTVLYAIASSVFGDGVSDLTRHTIMWPFGLSLILIGTAVAATELLRKSLDNPKENQRLTQRHDSATM
ncbi:GtrA family protein [Caballeronia sp. S22]|uniref:GtrA family protein n=1 Tax=Caballeronia sp. S22 TaxID=3137182 RepID=UPI0035309576